MLTVGGLLPNVQDLKCDFFTISIIFLNYSFMCLGWGKCDWESKIAGLGGGDGIFEFR